MDLPKIKIEVWSDFRCPFCYIAYAMMTKMVASMANEAQFEIVHRAYELYPDAPKVTDNTILDSYSKKYGISKEEAEEKIAAISEYGRKVGINNFNYGGAVPTNSFDAHRLEKYAYELGDTDMFEKLMYAYFCDNVNIADWSVLLDIAQEAGLNRTDTEEMLKSDSYAKAVRNDEALAAEMGIRSVPCFFVNNQERFLGSGCFSEMREYINTLLQEA